MPEQEGRDSLGGMARLFLRPSSQGPLRSPVPVPEEWDSSGWAEEVCPQPYPLDWSGRLEEKWEFVNGVREAPPGPPSQRFASTAPRPRLQAATWASLLETPCRWAAP